ncbi:tyrosine-type recombinase/integrase [Lysinibacillus sp. NPDC097287]|uniref:tyrosine-type recombinase/integrase n=1 Tax=Lysinibacillus sp. NPDC097287 TaxID=3364144 RepID=UPI0037FF8C3E
MNQLISETTRNRCIFLVLLFTGIRESEFIHFQFRDIDRFTGHLEVNGKGGKQRIIPLRQDVLEAIDEYLQGERNDSKHKESPFLFLSQRAGKLYREGIRQM